jgi:DNA invertase Pin-like site-specific DNA recombinase
MEAVAAFATTNTNDFVLLVAHFIALAKSPRAVQRIWSGQVLAIAVLAKQLAEARRLIAEGQRKAAVARHLGADRSTLYRAMARTEQPAS